MDGQIAMIPHDMVDIDASLSRLERLKLTAAKYLKQHIQKDCSDPLFQQIMNSPDIQTFESFVLNGGCSEKDLLNIYRNDYYEQL